MLNKPWEKINNHSITQQKLVSIFQLMFLSVVIVFASLTKGATQNIRAINEFVDFANESIHGMLIAHRLFENYNQDLNKYVDLPGHQLNFYNNTDLPSDLFEDPENWFYDVSPREILSRIEQNSHKLPSGIYSELLKTSREMSLTTQKINTLRLTVADAINTKDLGNQDSLYSIYRMLEEAVDAYDLYNAQLTTLSTQFEGFLKTQNRNSEEQKFQTLKVLMDELYTVSIAVLFDIKNEQRDDLANRIKSLGTIQQKFKSYSLGDAGGFPTSGYVRARKKILDNVSSMIENVVDFQENIEIPAEYALYGSAYYYFNTKVINKINRYGNGMVSAINNIYDILGIQAIHKTEVPHYLDIIYPDKVEKQIPVIRSRITKIDEAPETLENRDVIVSKEKHTIYVDIAEPTLEIFDHLQQDGDIISLNFNGDWIFENLSLERNPRKFILKLNESGKNFLILHAINEGSVPPNTIGINYVHEGRRKRYIMQSNLRTSQLVEIKIGDKEKDEK